MDRLARRYRLEERISAAGVGSVWSALDERSGQPVAVRFLERGADDPRRVDLFRASAYAAARLRHPYIARVLDEGDDVNGYGPYIVSEWIDGQPLRAWIGQRPEWGFVRAVLTRVCDALAYLHARGMVHLDLRPNNIMVRQTPDGPEVRILGVGCTRIDEGHGDRRPGARLTLKYHGSLRYLAPEVAESPPWMVGPWSDLYALGLVLWELLMGEIPFGDQQGVALMLARQSAAPPQLPPDAGGAHHRRLDGLLSRLLVRDPALRPRSAAQVGRTLAAMGGAPVWVPPVRHLVPKRTPFNPSRLPVSAFPLHPLQVGVLVERDPAIAQVWSALQATAQGFGSRLVVVEGAMATGKSALVGFVSDHAEVQGVTRTWRVRFQPGEAPGSGLAGSLERILRAGSADASGLVDRAQVLGPLLGLSDDPGFAEIIAGLLRPDPTPFARPPNALDLRWEAGRPGATSMLVGAFLTLVRRAATRDPILLWLDDVHFAEDEESIELVEAVLADGDLPVCVVVTARRGHPTTETWRARFPQGDPVRWIGVEPMTRDGAASYVQQRTAVTPAVRQQVFESTQTQPALLPELVDWLVAGQLTTSPTGYVLMPGLLLPEGADELRQLVFRELSADGPDLLVPDVIAGLALSQVPLTVRVIEALEADDPNRPYRRALFAAERGRWVVRDPLGGWRFVRPELAEWLRETHRARAASWHRRWSRALIRLESDARGRYGIERAWHADQLGQPQVALVALLDAAAWSLGPAQPSLTRGLAAAQRAEALADSMGLAGKAARAARLRAGLLRRQGDLAGATRVLHGAERRLAATGGHEVERGWCRLSAGWLALDRGHPRAAINAFDEAEPLFEAANDQGGQIWTLVGHGYAQILLGHHRIARRLGRDAEAAFSALKAVRGGLAARLLRAHAADAADDVAMAEQRYAALQAVADDHRWRVEATAIRLRRARLALQAGHPHDALALLDEAGRVAHALALTTLEGWISAVRPAAQAAAGDPSSATEALTAASLPVPAAAPSAAVAVRAALALPSASLDTELHRALTRWLARLDEQANLSEDHTVEGTPPSFGRP